jgi:hypothetical protein
MCYNNIYQINTLKGRGGGLYKNKNRGGGKNNMGIGWANKKRLDRKTKRKNRGKLVKKGK